MSSAAKRKKLSFPKRLLAGVAISAGASLMTIWAVSVAFQRAPVVEKTRMISLSLSMQNGIPVNKRFTLIYKFSDDQAALDAYLENNNLPDNLLSIAVNIRSKIEGPFSFKITREIGEHLHEQDKIDVDSVASQLRKELDAAGLTFVQIVGIEIEDFEPEPQNNAEPSLSY